MPDVIIKEFTAGRFNIEMRITNRYGLNYYEVTANEERGGMYYRINHYQSPVRANALKAFARYKRNVLQE